MSDFPAMPQADWNMPPGVSASDIPGNRRKRKVPRVESGFADCECLTCGLEQIQDSLAPICERWCPRCKAITRQRFLRRHEPEGVA